MDENGWKWSMDGGFTYKNGDFLTSILVYPRVNQPFLLGQTGEPDLDLLATSPRRWNATFCLAYNHWTPTFHGIKSY